MILLLMNWFQQLEIPLKITRKSMFTDVTRTIDLPITEEQLTLWEEGMLIQKAMPNLSPDQREFIMTGVTSEEWNEAFKDA